jgi:hypothetical protein
MSEYDFLLTNCETDESKQNVLRNQRNVLLSQCDWTQLPDADLTDKEKEAWLKYRQALRDLPTQFTDLTKLKFPKKP